MNPEKYIKKLFGIDEIINLKHTQLDYQENIDNILQKLPCKDDVIFYYINSRKYFRQLQKDNFDTSIKDMNTSVKRELQKSITHYKELYDVLHILENNYDKCNVLSKYNNKNE